MRSQLNFRKLVENAAETATSIPPQDIEKLAESFRLIPGGMCWDFGEDPNTRAYLRRYEGILAYWGYFCRVKQVQVQGAAADGTPVSWKITPRDTGLGAAVAAEFSQRDRQAIERIKASLSAGSGDMDGEMTVVTGETLRQVYTSPDLAVNSELHRIMGRMIESDRPMFLLSNGGPDDPNGDRQLWINELACAMIQSSGGEAVKRSMRDYWNAEDLESLHQKLRDTSQPFAHPYRAILNDDNPDIWFRAVSRYEPVEIGGRSFRLSINQSFEIIGRQELVTFR